MEFGGSTQNAKAYCGCNSTNWVKLSHLTQSNLNADEQLWAQSTEPEWSFSEAHLKTEIQQLKKGIKNLSKENKELKDQMERVAKENKSTVWHGESRRKDREELRDEIKTLQKEVASIKSQFINFENPKEDGSGDGVLVEQIGQLHQENAELKAKFDEFEEYSEMIKNIQLDQERVEQNNREIEERSAEGSSSLEVKIEELHGKIDNFVAETKSNLNCKKNQLILKMKADIHKLQEKQKVLIDQSRNLQQQNIKRSKVLQNKLELTECKFNETVQIKTSLISYYYDVSIIFYYRLKFSILNCSC